MKINIINKSNNPLPKYATNGSAGMDLYAFLDKNLTLKGDFSAYDDIGGWVSIFPGGRALIPTGLYMEIPRGYELQIRPRSGLAIKQGVSILNSPGTIDSDYRGEIGIIVVNLGDEVITIKNGERICQAVLNKYEVIKFEEVDSLSKTSRGKGGFGHSGK
jgi:dUTP pyrophosphatase